MRANPEEGFSLWGVYLDGESNLAAYILANAANHYRWVKTQIRRWIRTRG